MEIEWRRTVGWARRLLRAGGDFVYPPRCPLCGIDVSLDETSHGFCAKCQQSLVSRALDPGCHRCGGPIGPHLDPTQPCMNCRKEHFAFAEVVRLGIYEEALRVACVRGKLPRQIPLVEALAAIAWDSFHARLEAMQVDLVTAVPHHWTQRLYRPHNPAVLLAEVWGRRLRAPIDIPILCKTRRTARQVSLTPTQRRANLKNAFRVTAPDAVREGTILLVDDVLTTGTTAHQAARALRAAGANRVVVAVLARGVGKK